MTQPADLAPLPFELVYDDGMPLESSWHSDQLPLLRELINQDMLEQGRTDFFCSTNIFVYYSKEQAREVFEEETKRRRYRAYRGPDVFWVGGVPRRKRQAWVSWEEGGRLPDVIFEMLSPSTASKDRGEKRELYEKVFRTGEYFMYEPETGKLEGLRLIDRAYRTIPLDDKGRLWSSQLGVFVGLWHGIVDREEDDWVRLFRPDGTLVPTHEERAEAERLRADEERLRAEAERLRANEERQRAGEERLRAEAERQRAEAAEAELARLRALLEERSEGSRT
ncbi:MAG TPA: Uma2 family endonuclease [Thermoanaerobaculia bacterium]